MKKKMIRVSQCVLSSLLAVSMVVTMLVSSAAPAEAKDISKQESVYVNAGADGTVSKITVSDWLKGAEEASGTISDSSNLQNIKNVKGDETFSQNGADVDWTGAGNDIYYQGESSEELPVDLQITYKLDGKEVSAEEIAGQSGKVEIHVSYTNKSKETKKINGEDTTIYTPFVMITGMILSSDNFSHIEVDNGRVINDGDKNIVVGMGIPGMTESLGLDDDDENTIPEDFTVTADATDFTLGNTFTYGTPSLLNELNLDDVNDLDDLEDKLTELTDSAEELVDGSEELAENLDLFDEKMDELRASVKTFQKDGVNKLADGIGTLAQGAPALVKGTNEYASGVTTFATGTTAYVNGAAKITSGCTKLYNSVKELPTQLNTFATGLKTYTGAVDQLGTEENVTQLKTGTKAVASGISTINEKLAELEESYATTDALVTKLEATGADATTVATLKAVLKQQKAAIQALKESTAEDSTLQKGADSVSTGVGTVMDSLQTLSGSSKQLTDATSQLSAGMPTLVAGAKSLKEGGEKLAKNNSKLKKASKKLVKASKTIKKSVKKVNKGVNKLNKGGKSLKKASQKLTSGVTKLDTASQKLANGGQDLTDGMSKFNSKGIQKLNDVYEDDLQGFLDRLKAIRNVGKSYKSFSGISDSMDGEVKFIIETAAIEKED